jgi:hypothetical protein
MLSDVYLASCTATTTYATIHACLSTEDQGKGFSILTQHQLCAAMVLRNTEERHVNHNRSRPDTGGNSPAGHPTPSLVRYKIGGADETQVAGTT